MEPHSKSNNGYFIYFAAFAVTLIYFNVGIGYGWSSPAIVILEDADKTPLARPATTVESSWITSLYRYSLGALVSAIPAEYCADKVGRKPTFLLFSLGGFASHMVMIFATTVLEFYVARFLIGLTLGCVSGNLTIYIAEIAENDTRATLSFMASGMMSLAIFLTYIVGPRVSIRTLSILSLGPTALFIVVFGLFVPESPYYFVMSHKNEKAEASLKKLRGLENVEKEFQEIINLVKLNKEMTKNRWRTLFFNRLNFKCLLYIIVIMTLGQMTGTTAIVAYLQTIFEDTGSSLSSDISAILVSGIKLVTCVVMFWGVEKIKRKTLIISSLFGMVMSLIIVIVFVYLKEAKYNLDAVSWLPILALMMYTATFYAGLGIVIFLIAGEILEPRVKMLGSTIASCFNLFWAFATATIFPSAVETVGIAQVFMIFTAVALLEALFVWRFIPETKGKSFLEIQNMLKQNLEDT